MRRLLKRAIVSIAVLSAAAGVGASPGLAQMSPDQVRSDLENAYDVDVLRIDEVETANGMVYEVLVMNRGGDFNEAFQVNRLRVDPASGNLISQFDNGPNGTTVGSERNLPENSGTTLRRNSF